MDHLSASVAPEQHSQEEHAAVRERQTMSGSARPGLINMARCSQPAPSVLVVSSTAFTLSSLLSSPMLSSYSALLRSLEEVIHKGGFEVAAPMVSI